LSWLFFAEKGDIVIVAPAFLGVCGILWSYGRKRDVIPWAAIFCLGAAIIWLLKWQVGTFDLHIGPQTIRARSLPSGHTGMSMIFYGQAAILLWQSKSLLGKVAAGIVVLFLAAICTAIYLVGWHSLLDIAAAIAIGSVLLVILNVWREKAPKSSIRVYEAA
jgi:membrane-associated phospholipid phosphatase